MKYFKISVVFKIPVKLRSGSWADDRESYSPGAEGKTGAGGVGGVVARAGDNYITISLEIHYMETIIALHTIEYNISYHDYEAFDYMAYDIAVHTKY